MTEKYIRILLVDDDDIDCEALERYIQKMNLPYKLKIAMTENEALDTLDSFEFDIVLLDYDLKTATGLDILPKVGDTPAIFITGSGSEEIAIEAMRHGACDYLIKDPDRNYLKVLPFTVKNVLEHKRAEMKFKRSEERFRALTENTTDLTVIFDENRIFKYINPSIENTFGYTTNDVIGKNMSDFIHPDDMDMIAKNIDQTINNPGRSINLNDFRARHNNGNWLYLSGHIIYLPEVQSVSGIVGNFMDITARKLVEKEREKLIEDLQEAIENIKQLNGLLPICSQCKKIRDDKGYWNQIEGYIQRHSEAKFSHGMCPECSDELYGDENWYIEMKKSKK